MNKIKLGKILQFQRGYDLTKKNIIIGKFPVVTSTGVMAYHNEFKSPSSIVIGRSGTIGKPQLIETEFWPHNTTLFINDFKGNNINYIYYLLLNLNIEKIKSGSNIPTLNRNHLHDISVLFEKNSIIQNKIGLILKNIDDKIELNNKINSELEAMAKTIYDYWFLQFEFPNGEGKPYKSSGGKMVWSDELKREIPEGWKVKKMEDYCNIFTGRKDVNQALEKGKYKFYSCSPNYKFSNDKLYEGKAILIAGNGSYTGRTIFVNEAIDLYQRTYACVSKNTLEYMEYLYYTLLKFFVPIVSGGTHGSAIPYIVINDIAKQKILINKSIIEKFQDIIIPIQNKIFKLKFENEVLASLRDFLLPLLMNGQVGFLQK